MKYQIIVYEVTGEATRLTKAGNGYRFFEVINLLNKLAEADSLLEFHVVEF